MCTYHGQLLHHRCWLPKTKYTQMSNQQQTDGIHCPCARCLRIRSHSVGPIPPGGHRYILEQIQHRAARFITGDYRSRHPGSVTTMLTNLNHDTLDNSRRDQRQKCMYRTVRGSIPALPTETFFQKTNKRHIHPKHFPDHVSSIFFPTTNNQQHHMFHSTFSLH